MHKSTQSCLRENTSHAQRMYLNMYVILLYHIDTGWRRCIGCLKLRVSFRRRATNNRALLQKLTYEDKAFYGFSPLCVCAHPLWPRCRHWHRRWPKKGQRHKYIYAHVTNIEYVPLSQITYISGAYHTRVNYIYWWYVPHTNNFFILLLHTTHEYSTYISGT